MIAVVPTLLLAELMEQRIAVAVVLLLHITVEVLRLHGVIHQIIVVVAVLLLVLLILQVALHQVPATHRVSLHRLARVVTQVVVESLVLAVPLVAVEVEEDDNDWVLLIRYIYEKYKIYNSDTVYFGW